MSGPYREGKPAPEPIGLTLDDELELSAIEAGYARRESAANAMGWARWALATAAEMLFIYLVVAWWLS